MHLIGLYLIDMHHRRESHRRAFASDRHMSYGRVSYGRISCGRALQRACISWACVIRLKVIYFTGHASYESQYAKIPTANSRPSELAPELARPRQTAYLIG